MGPGKDLKIRVLDIPFIYLDVLLIPTKTPTGQKDGNEQMCGLTFKMVQIFIYTKIHELKERIFRQQCCVQVGHVAREQRNIFRPQTYFFSRDPAGPTEFLQHIVSIFGINQHHNSSFLTREYHQGYHAEAAHTYLLVDNSKKHTHKPYHRFEGEK